MSVGFSAGSRPSYQPGEALGCADADIAHQSAAMSDPRNELSRVKTREASKQHAPPSVGHEISQRFGKSGKMVGVNQNISVVCGPIAIIRASCRLPHRRSRPSSALFPLIDPRIPGPVAGVRVAQNADHHWENHCQLRKRFHHRVDRKAISSRPELPEGRRIIVY